MTAASARPPAAGDAWGAAASIAAITAVGASGAITYPLIALLLESAGVAGGWIGFNAALAAFAIFAAGPLGPEILRRVDLPWFLAGASVLAAASILAFLLSDAFWWWCVARFGLGLATASLFLGSEYWIVASAPPGKRGRYVAAYVVSLTLGVAAGPAALAAVGLEGWPPFALGAAVCLAAAPIAIVARKTAPPRPTERAAPALRFFWTDPTLLWAVVLFGAIEFGAMGLAPVWGVRAGMSETDALGINIALAFGALLAQPAMAPIMERAPARAALIGSAVACLLASAALPWTAPALASTYVVAGFWGAGAVGLYAVALAEIGERYSGAALTAASGALAAAYGLGALIGPPTVGAMLDVVGPNGLPLTLAAGAAAYIWLAAARRRRSA